MNIVVIGQGAIGLLWYYKLSNVSHNNVSLQCSSSVKNIPTLMSFSDINNQHHQQPLTLATDAHFSEANIVIFCLKAFCVKAALLTYLPRLNTQATIILSHNGMLNIDGLSDATLKNHALITMLITHGSLRESHFDIKHTGEGVCDIGLLHGELSKSLREKISTTLHSALPTVCWHENIAKKQWLKLAINCVINPITAIYNCNNGDINSAKYTDIITAVINEIITLAQAKNIQLSFQSIKESVMLVAKKTAFNCSSMRSDVLAKRQTENEQINGYIHQLGKQQGITTPMNTQLWQQVKKLEYENNTQHLDK